MKFNENEKQCFMLHVIINKILNFYSANSFTNAIFDTYSRLIITINEKVNRLFLVAF